MNNKKLVNIVLLLAVILVMVLSIWGPEALARFKDKDILNEAHVETVFQTAQLSLKTGQRVYPRKKKAVAGTR